MKGLAALALLSVGACARPEAAVPLPPTPAMLLVANKGEDTLSFIDFATGNECARLPTGKAPHEIAISPDGKSAAVVAYGGSSIDLFDVVSQRFVKRIELAPNEGPHGLAWVSDQQIAVVFDRSNTLVTVDPRNGRFSSIPTGGKGSHMLAASADGTSAYVANIMSGTIGVFDLEPLAKRADIAVGGNPEGLALTRDGKDLWVGDDSGPRVKVVDLASHTVVATLPADAIAIRIVMSEDGKYAYASNFTSGKLDIYDVAQRERIATVVVSDDRKAMPVTLALVPGDDRLLVAETGVDSVAVLDLRDRTVTRRIATGRNGDGLAFADAKCVTKPLD